MAMNTAAKTHKPRPKKVRMDVRVMPEIKELLDLASEVSGRSATDIITDAVAKAAREEVERYQVLKLNVEAAKQFAAAMMREPRVREGLIDPERAHNKLIARD